MLAPPVSSDLTGSYLMTWLPKRANQREEFNSAWLDWRHLDARKAQGRLPGAEPLVCQYKVDFLLPGQLGTS